MKVITTWKGYVRNSQQKEVKWLTKNVEYVEISGFFFNCMG